MNQQEFRNLFWKYDVVSLRGMGVPEDEYDGEADMAFQVIDKEDSLILIQLKLLSIFDIWFEPKEGSAIETQEDFEKEFISPEFKLLDNSKDINQAVKLFDSRNQITNLAKEIFNDLNNNAKTTSKT